MSAPDLVVLSIEVNESANTDEIWYSVVPFAGTWKLESAYFVPDTTTAADASDYVKIEVFNGSTSLGSHSTKDDAEGALTAGTAAAISLSGGASLEFTGQTGEIKVATDNTGSSGKAIEGRMVLGLRKVRV